MHTYMLARETSLLASYNASVVIKKSILKVIDERIRHDVLGILSFDDAIVWVLDLVYRARLPVPNVEARGPLALPSDGAQESHVGTLVVGGSDIDYVGV